jgi:hypothetical protein
MTPELLTALTFVNNPKGVTVKAFDAKYDPIGPQLRAALLLHVEETKGKLKLNEAGLGVLKMFGIDTL